MNQAQLLKKLLPGFIPLFVFIAADEIWGTKIGLIAAISFGIFELGWIGLREKRFDKFILFDTILLVVLGIVSILLENDLFFKLKPAFIEAILVGILGISAFSSFNILGLMGQRYLKEISFNQFQMEKMKKNLKLLFFIFLLHTILVLYAAIYMSDEAWAFVSGVLFYLIFGLFFFFQLVKNWLGKGINREEWLPVVDENGMITGKAKRSALHKGDKLLHPVVHMHLIHPEGKILLQKRSFKKQVEPGKWDTAVGGHICYGEKLEDALQREASEEIGLNGLTPGFLKTYLWETSLEAELVYLFVSVDYPGSVFKSSEAVELRFWTKRELENNLGKGKFTPALEHEYSILKSYRLI